MSNGRCATARDGLWTITAAIVIFLPLSIARVVGPPNGELLAMAIVCLVILAAFLVSPIRALALLALFSMFVATLAIAIGPKIKLADELLLPVLALITLVTRRQAIAARFSLGRDLALAAFVLVGAVSSLLAGVTPSVWVVGLYLSIKCAAIFYLALVHEVHDRDVRWISRLIFGVACVVLALGFVQIASPAGFIALGLPAWAARAGLPAINSLFYHPQLFGWLCGFVALYMLAAYVASRQRRYLVLAILFTLGTILSARRRAMLGIVAGLGVGIAHEFTARRRALPARLLRWVPATASVLVLGLAFLPALSGLVNLTVTTYLPPGTAIQLDDTGETVSPGAPARLALLSGSIEIARDYFPLGAGFGRYGSWMSRQVYSDLYPRYKLDHVPGLSPQDPEFITDTFWPQVLGETGVIGTAAFVIFLGFIGLQLLQRTNARALPPFAAAVALGTLLVFGQTLVESLASPIFSSPAQIYLIMLATGGVLSWIRPGAPSGPDEPTTSPQGPLEQAGTASV